MVLYKSNTYIHRRKKYICIYRLYLCNNKVIHKWCRSMVQRVRRSKVGAAKHGAVKQGSRAHTRRIHSPVLRFLLCVLRPPKCQPLVLWELARDIGAINVPLKLGMSHRADWLLALLAAAHLTLFRTGGSGCRCW